MKRTVKFLVTMDVPKGKTLKDIQDYVRESVLNFRYHQAQQDSILDFESVKVKLHNVVIQYD